MNAPYIWFFGTIIAFFVTLLTYLEIMKWAECHFEKPPIANTHEKTVAHEERMSCPSKGSFSLFNGSLPIMSAATACVTMMSSSIPQSMIPHSVPRGTPSMGYRSSHTGTSSLEAGYNTFFSGLEEAQLVAYKN